MPLGSRAREAVRGGKQQLRAGGERNTQRHSDGTPVDSDGSAAGLGRSPGHLLDHGLPSEMGGVLADIPAALGAGVVDRCWWYGDE